MKKYLFFVFLISLLLIPLGVFAQEETEEAQDLPLYLETTTETEQEDTGIEEDSGFVSDAKELFRIVGEELTILFTFDPEKKIDKRLEYAQERFDEMQQLVLQNGDAKDLEKKQERYLRQIEQALQIAYKHTEKQTEKVEKITAQYEKHRAVLEKVSEQVPQEAQPSINKVIEKIDTRYEEKLLKEKSKSEKTNNKGGKGDDPLDWINTTE